MDHRLPADGPGRVREVAGWVTTALACLLVLFALVAPNEPADFTPAAFLRIPVEALLGVAALLVLPARPRRVAAALAGVVLGVVAIMKVLDVGFFAVLARPFDPVLDWSFLGPAVELVQESSGRASAIGVVAAAVVLAAAVLVLMTLSVMRLTRRVVQHPTVTIRTIAVLGVAWVACAVLGVQVVPGVPVATAPAYDRAHQVYTSLQDHEAFIAELAVDAYRDTPAAQLLTALGGKDVVVVFVESYGRDAVMNPDYAPHLGAVLDAGTDRLRAAGFESRSAFLTSPTSGGGSWLAHSTLLSGLWVDNQQRYQTLLSSDRLTLNRAFQRAGWRTVGLMPGLLREWPEGEFYGYHQVYGGEQGLGYRGPRANWGRVPDQYTLSALQRFERARPDRPPVMAEIPLISTHAPWTPIPDLVDWEEIGDGTIFETVGEPVDPRWHEPDRVRANYQHAIEYVLDCLISYVETYGDEDLVLVFLGDHQPASIVTGEDASRDVPVTIVAGDPAVLDRIAGWGWHEGLRPRPEAPVWRMDAFRDQFLAAFSPQARLDVP